MLVQGKISSWLLSFNQSACLYLCVTFCGQKLSAAFRLLAAHVTKINVLLATENQCRDRHNLHPAATLVQHPQVPEVWSWRWCAVALHAVPDAGDDLMNDSSVSVCLRSENKKTNLSLPASTTTHQQRTNTIMWATNECGLIVNLGPARVASLRRGMGCSWEFSAHGSAALNLSTSVGGRW